MKTRFLCLWLSALFLVAAALAQQEAPARELYRIHFFKAAPGRLPDLIEAYRNAPLPDNRTPRPLVFRHRMGDDWDVMVIYPLGAKASLDANPAPLPPALARFRERVMANYAWHTDTYASGPPLAEVEKALALPAETEKSGGVYLAAHYTALAGHQQALADVLRRDMATAAPGSAVLFEHLQGASWDFLVMFRYASWQEWAAAESDPAADELARRQGFADTDAIGLELRQHMSAHHDNFLSRVQ
ncbi:MAG: hypothetical protein ACRD2R_01615 [Terriglobales bacterium]